jgi:NRAMP (natural resistance-associated macrophage protein)-like metal ion transporter
MNQDNQDSVGVKRSRLGRIIGILGPGLVTGAADDDPSGIATYSQAGAQFGYGQLWSALYQIPFLIAVQEACGRIGAVTGKGLAAVVKEYYSKKILVSVVLLVVVANTINIGADIGAVASSLQLVVELPFVFFACLTALVIVLLEVFVSYNRFAKILKWLALSMLAYPVTALIVSEPWREIIRATIFPHFEFTFAYIFIVVGVFGTTISPYMFFWQASQEVEEEIEGNIFISGKAPKLSTQFISNLRIDTTVGMLIAEIVQWFIIITTGTVLFGHGITNINSAADAAKALEPLVRGLVGFSNAGQMAKIVFAIGIVGLGLLAIPVLAGSAAYALTEAFGWREGLNKKFLEAKAFYGVIITATFIGLLLNFIGIDPIKALILTAVFNGVSAVPLLFIIAKINGRKDILGEYVGGKLSVTFVWLTFGIMAISAVALFYTLLF